MSISPFLVPAFWFPGTSVTSPPICPGLARSAQSLVLSPVQRTKELPFLPQTKEPHTHGCLPCTGKTDPWSVWARWRCLTVQGELAARDLWGQGHITKIPCRGVQFAVLNKEAGSWVQGWTKGSRKVTHLKTSPSPSFMATVSFGATSSPRLRDQVV